MSRKLIGVLAALAFAGLGASSAFAGPSRALVQEMGSVIAKDEVNIDLDVVSHDFNVITTDDTKLGAGNATLGGTTVSSVNVGIADNLELRIGRLPNFKSYLALPVGAPNNYGLSVKGAITSVPGLAAWAGYGTADEGNINSSSSAADRKTSSMRLGAAYTTTVRSPWILNGTIGYAVDNGDSAGASLGKVTTTEVTAAALYPLRPAILAGVELLYGKSKVGAVAGQEYDITVIAPAVGVRAIKGNWTIDAVVALIGTSVKVDGTPALAGMTDKASSTVVGVPNLRVNYTW